ncbi:hypothetical protein L5515_004796 [Caenorhabditis briggsae]|uniref:Uncharacterized protein n=1 Tax=Caenorhabditis briggsae TaxID=6238 RepID=A0AAE9EIM1_CAEBR|nr:hypothetical protein L5515_004796 [Caenorhabditis briggsae]
MQKNIPIPLTAKRIRNTTKAMIAVKSSTSSLVVGIVVVGGRVGEAVSARVVWVVSKPVVVVGGGGLGPEMVPVVPDVPEVPLVLKPVSASVDPSCIITTFGEYADNCYCCISDRSDDRFCSAPL